MVAHSSVRDVAPYIAGTPLLADAGLQAFAGEIARAVLVGLISIACASLAAYIQERIRQRLRAHPLSRAGKAAAKAAIEEAKRQEGKWKWRTRDNGRS